MINDTFDAVTKPTGTPTADRDGHASARTRSSSSVYVDEACTHTCTQMMSGRTTSELARVCTGGTTTIINNNPQRAILVGRDEGPRMENAFSRNVNDFTY